MSNKKREKESGSLNEQLLDALCYERAGAVEELVAKGVDVNQPIGVGVPPLFYLVGRGPAARTILSSLVQAGANLEARGTELGNSFTPLLKAVYWGSWEYVKLLIEYGADVDVQDDKDRTPLIVAVMRWSADERHAYEQVIQLLLRAGADVNLSDKAGKTALLYAIEQSFAVSYVFPEKIVRWLRKAGADERGVKALTLLKASRDGNLAAVKRLVASGVDINAGSPSGDWPLRLAARCGRADVVKVLLKADADLAHADENGCTALHWAVLSGQLETAKLLLEAGADPFHESGYGNVLATAMGITVEGGKPKYTALVEYLRGVMQARGKGRKPERKLGLASLDMEARLVLVRAPIDRATKTFADYLDAQVREQQVFAKEVTNRPRFIRGFSVQGEFLDGDP